MAALLIRRLSWAMMDIATWWMREVQDTCGVTVAGSANAQLRGILLHTLK